MSPSQILYASQASKKVHIKCPSGTVEAEIVFSHDHQDVDNTLLYISPSRSDGSAARLTKCLGRRRRADFKIEFKVKHFYFSKLQESVQSISEATIRRILPSKSDFKRDFIASRVPRSLFCCHQLDWFQYRALKTMVFSSISAPILVPGPFGSGKTRLLSAATEYFISSAKRNGTACRVLLCCHHQSSADIFMEDYFLEMLSDTKNPFNTLVVRVNSKVHYRGSRNSQQIQCDVVINEFNRNIDYYKSHDHIVVVTTYITSLEMYKSIGRDYFTHILIDEGAQAREPESIAPLSMAGPNTRIIIVGDDKQVGPKLLVLGEVAQNNGLGDSLLERLLPLYREIPNARKSLSVLRNNYRCVPDILKLSSDLFYDSSLIPSPYAKATPIEGKTFPLKFICSSLNPDPVSTGCEDETEAEIVVDELRKLLFEHRLSVSSICIISPSPRQVSLINKLRMKHRLPRVKTLPTYQIQGQQFDVLLVSTIESTYSNGRPFDPLKSLCHPAVFNTVITRARSLIIAVGNPYMLRKAENAIAGRGAPAMGCWDAFIRACQEKSTFDDRQSSTSHQRKQRHDTRDGSFVDLGATPNKTAPVKDMYEGMGRRKNYTGRPKLSSESTVPPPCVSQVQTLLVDSSKAVGNVTGVFTSTSKQHEYLPTDARLSLTVENYKKKFGGLVQLEKEEHVRLLSQHCDGEYELRSVSSDDIESTWFESVFHIHGLEPEQILYASQACSSVFIKCPGGDIKTSIIFDHRHYDNENEVLRVGVSERVVPKLSGHLNQNGCGTFVMSFGIKHSYFNNLMTSIDRIRVEAIKRIMPTADDFEEGLDLSRIPKSLFPENQLDEHQFKALQTMVFSRSTAPVIVPGPFGSGKTRLLSVASEYFITRAKAEGNNARILLCCHHQSSADIFMRDYFIPMLKNRKKPWEVDVVRVTSQTYRKEKNTQNTVDFNSFENQKGVYLTKDCLIVVTTYLTALRMSEFIHPGFFTHILIDEGAQAREPECIAPLSMADRNTRIIVVGDSKQVGPKLLVLGKEPQDHGLGESLLTRLQKHYMSIGKKANSYCVTLLRNYRCVADILDLPSTLFYESKLVPCAPAVTIASEYPLKFVCCKEVAGDSENQHEAEIIVEELRNLVCGSNALPSNVQICIMHTSRTQESLTQKLLWKERNNRMRNVKLLSTYQMQGQEFDVLILSTVEKLSKDLKPFDPLKSICHPAVFNTAITRVRSLVIAVGCPSTLIASENAIGASSVRCWEQYIDRCKAHNTYYENVTDSVQGFKINRIDSASLKNEAVSVSAKVSSAHKTVSSKQTTKPKENAEKQFIQPPLKKSSITSVTQTSKSTTSKQLNPSHSRRNTGLEKPNELSTDQQSKDKHPVVNQPNKANIYPTQQKEKSANNARSSMQMVHSNQNKRTSSKASQKSVEPTFSKREYSEQYPTLKDSMNMPKKAVKMIKKLPEKISVRRKQEFRHVHRPHDQQLLQAKFTRSNYRERFHQLLCREEDEHSEILKKRCDGIYIFYIYQQDYFDKYKFSDADTRKHVRFGYITADHLDEDKLAYAKQASEGRAIIGFSDASGRSIDLELDIVGSWSPNEHQCLIYLGFEASDEAYFSKSNGTVSSHAKVTFILKYSYFDRLHDGLDAMSNGVIDKLMPEKLEEFSPLQVDELKLHMIPCVRNFVNLGFEDRRVQNPQMFALKTIMKADPSKAPILIAGSFGTGKTRLLARAAYQILYNDRNAKVLVCAHHQKSLDSFVENYFGPMVQNGWLCGNLVRVIPNKYFRYKPEYADFYKTGDQIRNLQKKRLQLVLTTYSSARRLKDLGRNHFTHLLLDEGAQCREPETIIPLSLINSEATIVIAGDHKQVGPSMLVLGEVARKYGLRLSLLERLHDLYHNEKLIQNSEHHCVTLLTNFRSHHALLSLPSYLFYSSALVTAAEASRTQLHPDAPYPLKFVCSGIDDKVTEVTRSRNESERRLILDQLENFIKKWPKEDWGPWQRKSSHEDPKICIMATTQDQKLAFRDEIRSQYKRRAEDIAVLTVFDMQGREFQAVFLSTAEPIEKGKSKNPTKSPCDQFVFNTAITRAKSVVVCTGNPFLLMKVEKNMNNVDNSFWRNYFRRCMTTKSFIVPSRVRKTIDANPSLLDKLYRMVFTSDAEKNSEHKALSSPQPQNDSIMKVLEESLARKYNVQECKLRIKQQKDEYLNNWEVVARETRDSNADPETADDDERDSVKITCELEIKTPRRAIAIPLDSPQDSIIINGYHHRQGAFNGDIVEVALLGCDEEGKKYGRVTNVKEFHHPIKYICKADARNVIFFNPVDRTAPSIVNLPKISRSILQYKQEELNELQKNYITVFEESSLADDDDELSLKIKELVPFDMISSLLFVVKVLSWSPKFRKPLGAVIEALPRTNNSFLTEKLLLVAHDIQHNEEEYTAVNDEEAQAINPRSTVRVYRNALTIDPDSAINFDDALTIVPVDDEPNTYELAVLIIDVAECIQKDSELDRVAQRHGTSVYPGNQVNYHTWHMLPSAFTQSKLTLSNNGEKRPVIVVSARIKLSDDGDGVVEVAKKGVVSEALLQDPVNLTYGAAQCIMNSKLDSNKSHVQQKAKEFDESNKISLKQMLNLLYKVAMKIRIDRLQDAAFNYHITEPEEEKNWQTHLLVEELMIWANHSIANYMIEERPDVAVVRSQQPPLSTELIEFSHTHSQFLDFSLSHKRFMLSGTDESHPITAGNGLMITGDIVKELQQAYESHDLGTVARILSLECNFSQLAMLEDALTFISKRARYTFINPSEEDLKEKHHIYHHYSLRQLYTHFSSPIRRYADIIVQRIVKALVQKKEMPYSEEELKAICRSLNLKMLNSRRYSKDIDQAHEAFQLEDEGMKEAKAFVISSMQNKSQNFHLFFLDGRISEFMYKDDSSFDYSELNYHKRESSTITWEVTVVPLNGEFLNKSRSLVKCSNDDDNDDDEIMKVNFYPALADEDAGRCCKEYKLHIINDNRVVQLETWKLAHDCVKEPSKENIDRFMSNFLPSVAAPPLEEPGSDCASTGVNLLSSPLVHYTVRTKLGVGYLVKVWIGTSTRKAISSTSLQMIEVAPTLRICLKHIQNPSACFSNRELKLASKSFENLEEYVDAWSNALLAEGCHDGVKTNKMAFLKGACLKWPALHRSEVSIDKEYYKPQSALTLEISLKEHDMMDFIDITVGDLVCARYEVADNNQKTVNEVYHFYVSSVIKPEEDMKGNKKSDSDVMTISFHSYGEEGCKVSKSMEKLLKLQKPLCDLQIMKMSVSFSRLFQRLQSLKEQEQQQRFQELPRSQKQTPIQQKELAFQPQHPWMDLAKDVASGKDISTEPDLCKEYLAVFNKDSVARSLWDQAAPLNSTQGKGDQLNKTQCKAIKAALQNKFQLIQGPPGTGKSVTGAHLAYIFATTNIETKNGRCVLYCAPSNKAVDVVHYQLIKVNSLLKKQLRIIRLYGRAHEQKDFPNPIMEVMKMTTPDEQIDSMCPESLKDYALHHKIRDGRHPLLNNMEEKLLALKKDGKIPSSKERIEYKQCLSDCESTELQNFYNIILCTCNETCSVRLLKACKRGTKDEPLIAQCIVDECGMATEPETIAAISRCDHAVLIGDHKQLQPVVKHTPAKKCGLSRSLFQRYAEDYDLQDRLVVLEDQYRMHSYICNAPSSLFYESCLRTAPSVESRKPLGRLEEYFRDRHKNRPRIRPEKYPGNCPVLFYDIEGIEESGMADESVHKSNIDAHSKSNKKEAEECVKVIKDLMKKYSIQPRSIAVLTPYSAQKSKITELLEKEKIKKDIKVISIVESQGDEYDVVIISTVRTLPRKQIRDKKYVQPDHRWKRENLGFLMDSHQLNVAITRARHGLIIIGDCVLLEYDDTWEQLIQKYREDDLIIPTQHGTSGSQ